MGMKVCVRLELYTGLKSHVRLKLYFGRRGDMRIQWAEIIGKAESIPRAEAIHRGIKTSAG